MFAGLHAPSASTTPSQRRYLLALVVTEAHTFVFPVYLLIVVVPADELGPYNLFLSMQFPEESTIIKSGQ